MQLFEYSLNSHCNWNKNSKTDRPGPVSRKPRKLFVPEKPFSVFNIREVYVPETYCLKNTSPNFKKNLNKTAL